MKRKNINYIILGIFLLVFFFEIIPVPLENIAGIENPDEYIFGGFYWTSVLYQLDVGNYFGSSLISLIFLVLFGTNHLLNIKELDNGICK